MGVALVALVGAQNSTEVPEGPTCYCGAFITLEGEGIMYQIHSLPSIEVGSCGNAAVVEECMEACAAEWIAFSGNGDFQHQLPNGYTVGQELCIGLVNGGHYTS